MPENGPEKILFVGGAPRSGTTVTHALVCTSLAVNQYVPEVSFFRGIPVSYRNGLAAWQEHTRAFFKDHEQFRRHSRQLADFSLAHIWNVLGRPRILALKDPELTPLFPQVHALYPDLARFITVIRHPYDVVRSRQEVHNKSQSPQAFGTSDVVAIARQYVAYYNTVLSTNFSGHHFAFRYEDIESDAVRNGLPRFVGVENFYERPMWGTAADLGEDPWGSPKYYQPINLEPRLDPLLDEYRTVVRGICAPIMARFGYE